MKNRSCPDKIACYNYDASNCEECAVGDLILRQKKRIKRLKSEIARLTSERDDYKHRAEVAEERKMTE